MRSTRQTLLLACCGMLLTLPTFAIAANPTFTDAREAGEDFAIQGEYSGESSSGDKWGAQVIAQGDHKFKIIGFKGGLPGDGWDGELQTYLDGELKDGKVEFSAPEFIVRIEGGGINVLGQDGTDLAKLKKVERKSSTLDQKPPAGAIVLFDGSEGSLAHWENAKLVDGKYLGATNCSTKQEFGDHTLHVEFRTPFMPKSFGQERGNSGVYLQSRYELQVLDSFGLEGKDNECGGIYSINKPKLNMCYPPLSWQTYDIEFTAARYDDAGNKTKNARATIKHNGVVIHDNLELIHGTPGRFPEGPGKQGLFLQNHGNPVAYRNIWIVEKN